jgi:hypothetical protein
VINSVNPSINIDSTACGLRVPDLLLMHVLLSLVYFESSVIIGKTIHTNGQDLEDMVDGDNSQKETID